MLEYQFAAPHYDHGVDICIRRFQSSRHPAQARSIDANAFRLVNLPSVEREFITLLGGTITWPLPVQAQDAGKTWHIGFIARGEEKFYDALFDGLRGLGYEEGRNLLVERRYAGDSTERFHEFAAEMVQLKVDLIIVVTTPAALAVKTATSSIPAVFSNAINPVESGVVASLAQPGADSLEWIQPRARVERDARCRWRARNYASTLRAEPEEP